MDKSGFKFKNKKTIKNLKPNLSKKIMSKKKTIARKTVGKKTQLKNVPKKNITSKKKIVTSKITIQKRKAKKNNLLVPFLIVSGIISCIAFVLFIYPAIAFRIGFDEDKMVLSETTYGNNTYGVSEDDLLMFATIGLKSRALATRTWTSTSLVSDNINVHR